MSATPLAISSVVPPSPLLISPVDPREPDAAALIALLSRDLSERYDFVDDGSGAFAIEDVLQPRTGFLVGRVGNAPGQAASGRVPAALAVACGAYRLFGPDEPHVAEVKRMYVRPEFRGRGYSAAILAELERRANADGYRTVRLETGNRQPEAIRLYESRGYRRIGNWGNYAGKIEHQCYEKALT